ncbi:Mitochondrial distribution and morphology protein 32 [Spathaspora sp. JA1]|nr:Mitochondrial distribution and morphology protein 32 [Spathaspora sp. JA1]
MSAFISSFIMGNLLWIILGTTTFALMIMNSLYYFDNLYEKVLKKKQHQSIFGYITSSILSFGLGIKIQFEKGGLPELIDGKLRFKNVGISSDFIDGKIETLDVTLSFNKWYEGNGLIYNLEIFGLNGKIFKQILAESRDTADKLPEQVSTSFIDSNYQFEHVLIHDSYLEVHEESDIPPIKINIFNCELSKLRGDKLLLDLFNANNASGTINNSMFTIHKRQSTKTTDHDRVVRFKLDSIDLGELSKNNPHSKFNWLINGKAEIIADIKLPSVIPDDDTTLSSMISKVVSELKVESPQQQIEEGSLLKDAIAAIYHTFNKPEQVTTPTSPYVLIKVSVKLTDLKASLPQHLPLSNSKTPFISLTDLRSLINYINNATIPININTLVIERITGLYNNNLSSTSNIIDYVIGDIYQELNQLAKLDQQRIIHNKSSMWSHSLASQLLVLGLGVIV